MERYSFKNFSLYWTKCKQETLIKAENLRITVIKNRIPNPYMYAAVYGQNHSGGFSLPIGCFSAMAFLLIPPILAKQMLGKLYRF